MTITQFSPIRTGSTLLYNILNELFPNEQVMKVHNMHNFNKKTIYTTYRHPFDCIISVLQCNDIELNDTTIIQKTKEYLSNGGESLILHYNTLKKLNNVVLLKYELFLNDFDYIFTNIEKSKDLKIDEELKLKIKEKFCLKTVSNEIKKFDSFKQYDKKTHWHGKHISIDNGASFRFTKYFTKKQINLINDTLSKKLGKPYVNFMKDNEYKIEL